MHGNSSIYSAKIMKNIVIECMITEQASLWYIV